MVCWPTLQYRRVEASQAKTSLGDITRCTQMTFSKAARKYYKLAWKTVADQIKKRGLRVKYEDPSSELFTQPAIGRTYTPDFVLPNGIVVETKGRFTLEDRKKHRIQEQCDYDILCLVILTLRYVRGQNFVCNVVRQTWLFVFRQTIKRSGSMNNSVPLDLEPGEAILVLVLRKMERLAFLWFYPTNMNIEKDLIQTLKLIMMTC